VFGEGKAMNKKALLLLGVAFFSVAAKKNKDPNALPAAQAMTAGDKATGGKAHPQILVEYGGLYAGPQAAYVTKVGQKIAVQSGLSNAQGDFTVSLLNSSVNNAFAIPGGYIYVTRELMALMNNEAELASVLGHETGHVAARHAKKRNDRATVGGLGTMAATILGSVLGGDTGAKLGQQIGGGIAQRAVLGFSRTQEYQADDLGVSYLAKAGYDTMASSTMLASLAAQTALDARIQGQTGKSVPEWASTHPDPASRVARAAQKATAFGGVGKATNRDAFLSALDGVMYDDDPKQGVVDGTSFRHPDLKLAFSVPTGFAMSNGADAVTISGTGGQAQFSGAAYAGSLSSYIGDVFKAVGGQTTLNYGEARTTEINGLKAAYASANANTQSGAVVVTVFAYEFSPTAAYHFLTITPATSSPEVFRSMFNSMRRLTAQEIAAIKPRKIDVVTVKSGDTVASLSAKMAYPDFKEDRFRVLNALGASDSVKSGQKVKLVVY
jgi:predicted Zn-dependent protease